MLHVIGIRTRDHADEMLVARVIGYQISELPAYDYMAFTWHVYHWHLQITTDCWRPSYSPGHSKPFAYDLVRSHRVGIQTDWRWTLIVPHTMAVTCSPHDVMSRCHQWSDRQSPHHSHIVAEVTGPCTYRYFSHHITKTNENTVLYTNCIVKYHFLFPDRYRKREKCFETFNSCRHLMHGLRKLVTFFITITSYQTPD